MNYLNADKVHIFLKYASGIFARSATHVFQFYRVNHESKA